VLDARRAGGDHAIVRRAAGLIEAEPPTVVAEAGDGLEAAVCEVPAGWWS
jgi:hypothetical protein